MTYIYSPDDTTVHRRHKDLPATHWEVTSVDPPEGTYHDLTPANAESFGYYELVEVPRPDDDHARTIENIGPGLGFTEVWTFDQDRADANADQADRDVDADQLKADLQAVKDLRDEAALERDAAALSKAEMTEGDPAFKAKWTPLDGSGSNAQRIAALESLANDTTTETRKQYADHRKSWSTIRELSAITKRVLRVLRLDQ